MPFIDLMVMFTIWLNPVSLIRSVVRTAIFFVKMIFLMVLDMFIQVYRVLMELLLDAFREECGEYHTNQNII